MIFRLIFLFFLIFDKHFVHSDHGCDPVCVAFTEIPFDFLEAIFITPKKTTDICYYESLGIITAPGEGFFDKEKFYFVAWHPFLVENGHQQHISFFSYSRRDETYQLEARYLMFGLEELPKDYDWKTWNVLRQAFYVIAIKDRTLHYLNCPLKTIIFYKDLHCDLHTIDMTKNSFVKDSWNIGQFKRDDFNAYPLTNETLILNIDPRQLWKWDVTHGKLEICNCREVASTLWANGAWFNGEKITERDCVPSWNGSFNNLVDYGKDHPFADENGLIRGLTRESPTCKFTGGCQPPCQETPPWYFPLIAPILGFPVVFLLILMTTAYCISAIAILRATVRFARLFRQKNQVENE